MYDRVSHTYTHFYSPSFIGFAPVNNPAVVVAVTIRHTTGSKGFGASVAAPLFRDVASAALRVLDIPADLPGDELADFSHATYAAPDAPAPMHEPGRVVHLAAPADRRVPDFTGLSLREVLNRAAELGLTVEVKGGHIARSQTPAPGDVVGKHEKIMVDLSQ